MSRATLAAVAVISAAILAYQVLLMRLFSIVSWHHFAYMIISIVYRPRFLGHRIEAYAAMAAV